MHPLSCFINNHEKQPPEVFYVKQFSQKFCKIHKKNLCQSLFLFLRARFLTEHFWWLLLNHYGFFSHQTKVTQKLRKSFTNIKMYFKQFFTFLERNSTFIISLFRAIYRGSSSDAFTKNGVLLQVRSIFTEEYPCGTFAWMFYC